MTDEIKIDPSNSLLSIDPEIKITAKITRIDGTIEYIELTGEVTNG